MEPRTYRILNLGAGVQSTTVYLMSLLGEEPALIPRFDYAVFADTQEEPREVYAHLDWLRSLGGPPILTGTAGRLGDDLINGYARTRPGKTEVGFKQIPAFLTANPGVLEGKAQRHCTAHYKVGVVERVIRREILGVGAGARVPEGVAVVQYLGLSYDEPMRIVKVQDRFLAIPWATPKFPLWELQMTRGDCASWLEGKVPHPVPRSACVFCPFHQDDAWRHLRDNDPEGWRRSVEVDRALRAGAACSAGLDKQMFLHRSCVPLEKADIDVPVSRKDQHLFGFASECEGTCGT